MAPDAEPLPGGGCAVRMATNGGEERALAAHLDRHNLTDTVKFAPKDDDDLDEQLCAARFERVVFPSLEALLTAIWKGHAQVDRWTAAGVRIELADPPTDDIAAWQPFVTAMYESLARWRKKQRRRKIIAAVILSALALIAMAVLFYLAPPAT